MMKPFPDRETWERNARAVYFDMMDSFQSNRIHDYASEEAVHRYQNRELTDVDYERARESYYRPVGIISMGAA